MKDLKPFSLQVEQKITPLQTLWSVFVSAHSPICALERVEEAVLFNHRPKQVSNIKDTEEFN